MRRMETPVRKEKLILKAVDVTRTPHPLHKKIPTAQEQDHRFPICSIKTRFNTITSKFLHSIYNVTLKMYCFFEIKRDSK